MGSFEVVPDGRYLRLRAAFSFQVIEHCATGAFACLDEVFHLTVEEDGFASVALCHPTAAVEDNEKWVCELLDSKLCTSLGADARLFVASEKDGSNTWCDDIFDRQNHSKALAFNSEVEPWAIQCFVSTVPRGGFYIRWGVQYVLPKLIGNGYSGKYACLHIPLWKAFFKRLGFSEDHVRVSSHSLKMQSHRKKVPANPDNWKDSDPDNIVSTEGFLLLILYYYTSKRAGGAILCDDVSRRCDTALALFVARFLPSGTHKLHDVDDDGFTVVSHHHIENGDLVININNDLHMGRRMSSLRMPLAKAMLELASIARTPAKCASACAEAKVLLATLINNFGAVVEAKRGDPMFDESSHVGLTILHREGSTRPRRIPVAVKLDVIAHIEADPNLKTPQQLLSSTVTSRRRVSFFGKTAKQKRESRLAAKRQRLGKSFHQTRMIQYLATTRRDLQKPRYRELRGS
jgi:hypothetical protein